MRHRIAILAAATTAFVISYAQAGHAAPTRSHSEQIGKATGAVTEEAIVANEQSGKNWLSYNLGYSEQRYSKLEQVNTGNVDRLGLAWSYDLGSKRGVEASPIVVDDVMYVTAPWSKVHAVDARTGDRIWTYDPEVPKSYGGWACCDVVNRGVAVYEGKVFVGTLDGYLVALDAATGEVVWRRDTIVDRDKYKLTITGAPRVVAGNVVIGNGGAELAARGYVTAYDADTGDKAWRWFSVPADPEPPFASSAMKMAAETWDPKGAWTKTGGGGTIWDAMAYDPELGLLYVGVGNGNPWNREVRSPDGGDNLFLSSIVALDAETGEYVWHFQEVPGDSWDYTATQHIILADLAIDGEQRKVLLHAPKNGFFYVIDRTNGDLISAENFVHVNWAKGYNEKGRPIETEDARAIESPQEVIPSVYGAHNWHPMSFNPETGLVYIPAQGVPLSLKSDPDYAVNKHQPGHAMSNLGWNLGHLLNSIPPQAKPFGHLLAWDPVAQKPAWRQEYASPWNGGTLTTAGELVFQGTADARFIAYDAATGEPLWQRKVGSGVVAGPVAYELNGTQYVTIAVGWGGVFGQTTRASDRLSPGRVYTFKLDADTEMPPVRTVQEMPDRSTTLVEGYEYKQEHAEAGASLYVSNCLFCHGAPAVNNGGNLPNLGYTDVGTLENLPELVRGGAFTDQGMPEFEKRLTTEEVEKIAAYVQFMADKARNNSASPQ